MSAARFQSMPRYVLRPVPLWAMRPVLRALTRHIAAIHPAMFQRLGPHGQKVFVICPVNFPFALVLRPDPNRPDLRAVRRADAVAGDARISGTFLNLLRLIDGRIDGDALFFSRDLQIEGDTEAIVSLRNALDDVDGSIAEDVAAFFGPAGRAALALLRRMDERRGHADSTAAEAYDHEAA